MPTFRLTTVSKPTVFTFRLEVERYKQGLSRQALAEAVGTPLAILDLVTRGEPLGRARRNEILRRLARYFGMPEADAPRLLDRVYGTKEKKQR